MDIPGIGDPNEYKDYRIAQIGFGFEIIQNGYNILSCTYAKKGKKIFGNDPDSLNYLANFECLDKYLQEHPNGKVAEIEDFLRKYPRFILHNRSTFFSTTWKSENIISKKENKYFLYHPGSYTHFKVEGLTRLTSMEDDGCSFCAGRDDTQIVSRKVHTFTENGTFTPAHVDSIIVPSEDCFYHKTKMMKHYPFRVTLEDTVQITVDKPTWFIEFTNEPVDVDYYSYDFLKQIDAGLVEILDY